MKSPSRSAYPRTNAPFGAPGHDRPGIASAARVAYAATARGFVSESSRHPPTIGAPHLRWSNWAANVEPFYASIAVQQFTTLELSSGVLAAYDAPFPDETYTAGAHVFPSLAGTEEKAFEDAWAVLAEYDRPFLTAFGDTDPVLGGMQIVLRSVVRGAQGQPHVLFTDAGHFVQEDRGEVLAEVLVDWLASR